MFQQHISANKRSTILIMAAFVGVIGAVAWVISQFFGNVSLLWFIVGASLLFVIFQYFMADKLVLRSTGAIEIAREDNPRLWDMVADLVQQAGLPMPRVCVIQDPALNAFATGRDPDHAVVAATTGIIATLEDRELRAVLAHEIAHVKNYDIRVSMIAAGLASIVGGLTDALSWSFLFGGGDDEDSGPVGMIAGIILIILAPIAAALIQMAISRQREYLADATGADQVHDPEALAIALEVMRDYSQPMRHQNSTTAHIFFDNPLKQGILSRLFSTHPPIDDRISRLRNMK